jgi:hypothetical protein
MDLKSLIRHYREVDDKLRILNEKIAESRKVRKDCETQIATVLQNPQYASIQKFAIEDDGSVIRIQRPGEYSKGWNLPKKTLEELLNTYFTSFQTHDAKTCFEFIAEYVKRTNVGKEFALTRVVKEEKDE